MPFKEFMLMVFLLCVVQNTLHQSLITAPAAACVCGLSPVYVMQNCSRNQVVCQFISFRSSSIAATTTTARIPRNA